MPSRHVLVVDDDEAFVYLCKRHLKKSESISYRVDVASTVEHGRKLYQNNDYCCLLVDYQLPDGKGTFFLDGIKKQPSENCLTPSIVLTNGTDTRAAIDAIRSEATDFMQKSDVTATSLQAAIDNAVHKFGLKKEVLEKQKELQKAYDALKKRSQEVQRFYHTVSHEIKTPITAMREFVDLLNEEIPGPLNEEQHQLLAYTGECCDSIVKHFNDLLEMTRIDNNKLSLQLEQHDLEALIHFSVHGSKGLAAEKNINLQILIEDNLPQCCVDGFRMKQVMGNLIDNAIKFSVPDSEVQITASYDPQTSRIIVQVIDEGCGIDEQDIPRVFERLFQANTDSHEAFQTAGLGLGLSISREIIYAHGGDISVISTPGVGSTFIIELVA